MPYGVDELLAAPGLLPQHAHFADWSVILAEGSYSVSRPLWSDEATFSVYRLNNGETLIRFPSVAEFKINFADKTIGLFGTPSLSSQTLRHLLHDQVAPRILANAGELVLHAGAVETAQGLALVAGLSGEGKSTLLASFDENGFPLIGDDAMLLNMAGVAATARSLYRSLRLFPDSIENVLRQEPKTSAVADYTEKRNVTALDSRQRTEGYTPVRALFFLGRGSESVTCRVIAPSHACMLTLEHSFWIDPTDLDQTRIRLGQAARLADSVPAFILDYPRRYDKLPSVRRAMLEALGLAGKPADEAG